MTEKTKTCRVGRVEGPFCGPQTYSDGSPHPDATENRKARYYVVRWMDGTILRGTPFGTEAAALTFWKSLPEFN